MTFWVRAFMENLEEQVELQIIKSGSISIVAQAQQMKLPYSLLKSVKQLKNNVKRLFLFTYKVKIGYRFI